MKITSRNVNGIRAVIQKWFFEFIKEYQPDIICLQETKAFEIQLPAEFKYMMKDYQYVRHAGTKPWYAGTATFFKEKPLEVRNTFEDQYFHEDGRTVEVKYPDLPDGSPGFTLLNLYVPNGWDRADGREMLTYKLEFYEKLIKYVNNLVKNWENVIMCGDFNIAHTEIDIARPKENKDSIWFLPIEREMISKFISNWYVDCFRKFNPEAKDNYTRRSYRAWARPKNVWRRIDYFFVSENFLPKIKKVIHHTDIFGSDHCPISLER